MREVYLLHGKGGSPQGSVSKLEPLLREAHPECSYIRVLMPHHDPRVPAENSVDYLKQMSLALNARVIGISLGGLVAAKVQEEARPDIHVACVSSPTWAEGVRLTKRMPNRLAIYSSSDEVVSDRVAEWPELADAHDYAWLSHDTDRHKERICDLLNLWLDGKPFA